MDSVTTYDRIIPLYEAKRKTIEEGFKEFGARYTAHFSHWFPWGTMIYDRSFVEKPPQDPREAIQLHNRIWAAVIRAALAEGGVVNEHHGSARNWAASCPNSSDRHGPSAKPQKDASTPTTS